MLDLEDRIRTEVTRQADAYLPPADLPERITARVTRRRATRRAAAAGMAAALLVVVGAAGALALSSGPDRTDMAPADTTPPTGPTTVTPPPTGPPTDTTGPGTDTTGAATGTTGGGSDTTSPTVPPTSAPSPVEALAGDTPLDRAGVGPIQAGMTLREAAAASGRTVTPGEPIGPTSACGEAAVEGTAYRLIVTAPGDPGADPLDGVIQLVTGGRSTLEGVVVGSTAEQVAALYGPPTRTIAPPYTLNGTGIYVYEQDGVAYQVTFDPGMHVVALASGFPTAYPEGCA